MKYCKKCGVLYSDVLECCPKCNALLSEQPEDAGRIPEKREVRRQWTALLIGVPALILFLYFVGWSMRQMGAS